VHATAPGEEVKKPSAHGSHVAKPKRMKLEPPLCSALPARHTLTGRCATSSAQPPLLMSSGTAPVSMLPARPSCGCPDAPWFRLLQFSATTRVWGMLPVSWLFLRSK
jgi:hypothetical protein